MPKPPYLAEWLLARALGSDPEREMVLGDLHEQFERHGTAWYWRQALAIGAHAVARRTSASGGPKPSGDPFMYTLINDVRYAWRALFKRPLLTGTVAATLALGLGANAAIFNLIDRLILRPFPFADPDAVVMLSETGPGLDYRREQVAPANFLDWRERSTTLTHLSAFTWWDANLIAGGEPERIQGFVVSAGFFDALGVRPALGRAFVRDDETWGRHRVAVISHDLWTRRFAADPTIVGRSVTVDGELFQVVGVAPPRFAFPVGSEIWAPYARDPKVVPHRDSRYLTVVGRVAAGHSLADARAEMAHIGAALAREYPDANKDHGVKVYTLTQGMADPGLGPIVGLWQASAGVVLLIACANIANLLMARASERRREIAVRLALGAGRGRVVRELMTESVVLALVAVPPAIAFAWVSLHLFRVSMPQRTIRFIPGFETLGLDARLVAFTIGLAMLTAVVFGLLPGVQAVRASVSAALKEGGRSSTGRQWLRRAIVVAEMSIALPLLVAAGLGVLGTNRFLNGSQGYDPDGVLRMSVSLPERTYPDAPAQRRFAARALDGIRGVAGVERAAVISSPPSGGGNSARAIEIDGRPPADPHNLPAVDSRLVSPEYFELMRIPVRRGRAFTAADREDAGKVVIVSENMAAKFWPGEDPIGRRLKVKNGEWLTVVGISGDIIHDWFNKRFEPTMYRPFAQVPTSDFAIMLRTTGPPENAAPGVRQALLAVDATQPVFDVMTQRYAIEDKTLGLKYLATIMSVFAALALLLAAIGLYAVIAYLVTQRRHEIGLRLALGASAGDVIRMTVGQAMRLTLVGAAIGLALSVALSRAMEAGMLGIASGDARVLAGFAAVLIATALLAGYIPARRAAAIDPMTALRAE